MQKKIQKYESYIFGNSIASVVAVAKLRKAGKLFLWVQEGFDIEGVWKGINHKNRILDVGMINFETDVRHPESSLDLKTYSQYAINDCARFSNYVLDFISDFTSIKQLPKIKIFENKKLHPDHLISNDFSQLNRYGLIPPKNTITPEEDHPSQKYTAEGKQLLLSSSYDSYVKKCYGEDIAKQLFLNWAKKLVGEKVSATNTYRHRAIWSPLPYPETIEVALAGMLEKDLTYTFHYPTNETFSECINRVFFSLNNDQDIHKMDLKEIEDEDLKNILNSNSNIFWGGKIKTFMSIVGNNNFYDINKFRNLINIDIFEAELTEISDNYVILNNDEIDDNWYRLTVLPNVVVEKNRQILIVESRKTEIDFFTSQYFLDLGIKIDSHVKSLKGVPVFLTLNGRQYQEYETWHNSLINKYTNIDFGGGSSFAYSATFSDQVVQGMKFHGKVYENAGE